MKKTFCDICDQEITHQLNIPKVIGLGFNTHRVKELDLTLDSTPAGKDICLNCFIDAVNKLDRRDKVEQVIKNILPSYEELI